VKFFYNKLKFLHNRYLEIYKECLKRKFNITNYEENFIDLPSDLYNDYSPTSSDIKLNKQRLKEKIQEKPDFYKYY
jgi:deoxyribonuclease (pyrimidine dimer)